MCIRDSRYVESYETLPQNIVLGSETASTVSSRGVYKFPVQKGASAMYDDHQCSGYDVECCSWSNLPDEDFALADDYDWTIGQFVWTGFDYLGEPSPYSTDSWPSHSSVFGIIDLASLPKDRFYLYRSCLLYTSVTVTAVRLLKIPTLPETSVSEPEYTFRHPLTVGVALVFDDVPFIGLEVFLHGDVFSVVIAVKLSNMRK